MTVYLFPGLLGLLAGLVLRWCGFARADGLRHALGLRRSVTLRSGLSALGYAIAGTALLTWLAVIDVDDIVALPLDWRVLAGGGIFGVCAGLCGFTPSTAFAGLGAGNALEALCTLTGLFLATLFLPEGEAIPGSSGDLLTQGCAGLLLVAIGICIPNPKPVILTVEPEPEPETEPIAEPESAPDPESAPESAPTDAADDAFVAILEGEEPLVVDTDPPESASTPESAPPPNDQIPNS